MKSMPQLCADVFNRVRESCKTRINSTRQFLQRRRLESHLARLVIAAQAHEASGLAPGAPSYRLLKREAEQLIGKFSHRWNVSQDQLHADFPVLTRLQRLAAPAVRVARVGRALIVVAFGLIVFFTAGMLAGIAHIGYRLVGGGR
jgi:hypothetical protein